MIVTEVAELAVIDLGFSWTKGQRGGKVFRQPSVTGTIKNVFEEDIKGDDFVYDESLFVGNLASKHSDIKYFTMDKNKPEAMNTDVIMKTSLGYLGGKKPLNLLTGLPYKFYFDQKSDMENKILSFNDEPSFTLRKGKNKPVNIKLKINDLKIVPQGYGIAMDYILDDQGNIADKNIASKRILVVDLGFYTLNLLGLDKMTIMGESDSTLTGVHKAYKLIQKQLMQAFGQTPELYQLDRFVISGKYEGYDIRPIINSAFEALAIQIMNDINSLNMRFDYYLIGGGAAGFIFRYLDLPNKILFDQLSQINGYKKIGARKWK
ncbi:ParM/StbA family protein [Paenibacillus sp. Marseille-Q4541]|uniref:ParM/StbA family protein n=1 Tax=Paenibacillus sp. Marseille-Q4541 TaxID=2831522 RepID=UPI001BA46E4A|nr:ParM/StbA family protein [Paenibacillus sp. Marseille-Q4541]